jgi:hypothetical protein
MKKKSINRKMMLAVLLSSLVSFNATADSLLKKYVREHGFMPQAKSALDVSDILVNPTTAKPHEVKPHETEPLGEDFIKGQGLPTDGVYSVQIEDSNSLAKRYEGAYERLQNNQNLLDQYNSIINGGPLLPGLDMDIWWGLRGGELTGNGGGIVEVKFEYHYDRLGKYISDCVRSYTACRMSEDDVKVLGKIKDIAESKLNDPTRLIFRSGKENPDLFKENDSIWGVRTAKTGDSPDIPLIVNTDHLYRNGVPALNDDEIITMLVHETGHQAKEPDHAYLNRLGSELVNFLKDKAASVQREHKGVVHQVDFTNFEAAHQDAEATLTYANEQIDLRPLIKDSLSCPHPDQRVVGFELSNPFWKRESHGDKYEKFPMGLWAQINCQFMHQRMIYKRDIDMTLHFLFGQEGKRQLEEVHVEIGN